MKNSPLIYCINRSSVSPRTLAVGFLLISFSANVTAAPLTGPKIAEETEWEAPKKFRGKGWDGEVKNFGNEPSFLSPSSYLSYGKELKLYTNIARIGKVGWSSNSATVTFDLGPNLFNNSESDLGAIPVNRRNASLRMASARTPIPLAENQEVIIFFDKSGRIRAFYWYPAVITHWKKNPSDGRILVKIAEIEERQGLFRTKMKFTGRIFEACPNLIDVPSTDKELEDFGMNSQIRWGHCLVGYIEELGLYISNETAGGDDDDPEDLAAVSASEDFESKEGKLSNGSFSSGPWISATRGRQMPKIPSTQTVSRAQDFPDRIDPNR
jgi:hypothetical protein